MQYKTSKYGNIIKEENNIITLIPMDETSPLYQEYVQFLTAGGTVEPSNLFTEEEEIRHNCPIEIPLWRLRVVLRIMNLETAIENALELLQEPNRTAAKYIWEYGTAIDRNSPTVLFIQSSLGLTDLQVNDIFIQANAITL